MAPSETSWLLFLLQCLLYVQNDLSQSIPSFGFTTADEHDNDGHDANVTLTLYWNTTIFECIIPEDPSGQQSSPEVTFTCDNATIIGVNTEEEYKIKIFYDHDTMFRPTSFHVIDNDSGDKYTINSFCGPIQYYYFDSDGESLCTGYYANKNRYLYEYLELSSSSPVYLSTLYVSFIDNIMAYPNVSLPGSVSPAKVSNFSITTSAQSFNDFEFEANPVILRLYWDIYLYICSLSLNKASTTYECDASNTSQVVTNCSDYTYASINGNSLFTLFLDKQIEDRHWVTIDAISVVDESGYTYSINTFCEADLSSYFANNSIDADGQVGRFSSALPCAKFSSSLTAYEQICIDPLTSLDDANRQCVERNTILGIDFAMDLFNEEGGAADEGLVYPLVSLNQLICNGSTYSPTSLPTDAPTVPPSQLTTANPTTQSPTTIMPSTVPTEFPTFLPTAIPTMLLTAAEVSQDGISVADDSSFLDTQTLIIIILAAALVFVICCVILYCVYRRGVNKGMEKAVSTVTIRASKKESKGEKSNVDVLDGEHEEAPPAAYAVAIASDDEEKDIDITLPRVTSDSKGMYDRGGEGDKTTMNTRGDEIGDGVKETEKLIIDEPKEAEDSETEEMYKNNNGDSLPIATPGSMVPIPKIPLSDPTDSPLPRDDSNSL